MPHNLLKELHLNPNHELGSVEYAVCERSLNGNYLRISIEIYNDWDENWERYSDVTWNEDYDGIMEDRKLKYE